MSGARIKITANQAAFLNDLAGGSETFEEAQRLGVKIEAGYLIIPEQAFDALGTSVGIRADIADEGEYSIGERSTILGLARKLAKAGVTKAAPLEVT